MSEVLSENQYQEWDAFVRLAKGGTLFHTSWYLRTSEKEVRINVTRDKSGQIEAGLPIVPIRFLGTSSTRMPPLTHYNGPLFRESEAQKYPERLSEEKERLLRILADSPRMGLYDYMLPPEHTDVIPYLWNGFDAMVYYTYQIPPAPEDQWRKNMSHNHSKNLRLARNALKEIGGTIEVSENIQEYYPLMQESAKFNGFPPDRDYARFERWWQAVRRHDAATLYVLRDGQGRMLVGNIAVHDWSCLYAIIAGVRGGRLPGREGYLHRLVFEYMILDAHRRGLTFDFEGSILAGIEPYFRGWGGQCVPKYRVLKIPSPLASLIWHGYRYWTRHRSRQWVRHD